MMYRRNAAQTPRPGSFSLTADKSFATMAAGKILEFLASMGVIALAERENRKWNRLHKRQRKHTTYFAAGLNGERAMARRRRQRETDHGCQGRGYTP